ncbi:MAG TPA: hypothetical protein VJZ26_07875 [Blastocatellia bacterium]|nr:hypothetical protein [Blastocatellia bacterium]
MRIADCGFMNGEKRAMPLAKLKFQTAFDVGGMKRVRIIEKKSAIRIPHSAISGLFASGKRFPACGTLARTFS